MAEGPLVAGVDSSTQSTKVAVVDSASGEIVAMGRAPHVVAGSGGARESDPESWHEALRAALAETGRGARHRRHLDRRPAARAGRARRPRPAPAGGDALERHPRRRRRPRPGRRARSGGVGAGDRSGAGGVVHRREVGLARPERARDRRGDRRGAAAARLPRRAADRTGDHYARRRLGHGLVRSLDGCLPRRDPRPADGRARPGVAADRAGPGRAGRPGVARSCRCARPARGHPGRPRHRRQHGRGAGARLGRGEQARIFVIYGSVGQNAGNQRNGDSARKTISPPRPAQRH